MQSELNVKARDVIADLKRLLKLNDIFGLASEGNGEEDGAPAVASNYRWVSLCLLLTFNQDLTRLNTSCSVDLQSVP